MDYEKKYKEALERARALNEGKTTGAFGETVCEYIFPELKENEDKRIRKQILAFLKEFERDHYRNLDFSSWITWVEKQNEQKEYTFKSLPRLLEMVEPTERAKAYCQKLIDTLVKEGYSTDAKIVSDCLKKMNGEKVAMVTMDEQNPTKWSEEDKDMLDNAVYACQRVYGKDSYTANWLQKQKLKG